METRRQRLSAGGRTVLVLFFCVGIAFLGLLTGGEHPDAVARLEQDPMAGYYDAPMPQYPGARELPAGPESRVGGSHLRMSHFVSDHEPLKIARYYEAFWREKKLFVRQDVTHQGGVVSAVDNGGDRVLQVLLVRSGGQTQVFPSVTRSPLQAMDTSVVDPPVPLFEGSRRIMAMESDAGGGYGAGVLLTENDAALAPNVTHYARALKGAGYAPQPGHQTPAKGPQQLVYHRQGSEVTVSLTALGEKRTRVHLMEIKSGGGRR